MKMKIQTFNTVAAALCAALLAAGCPQEAPRGQKGGFGGLPDDAAIITVDGRSLTKGEFSSWVALRRTLVSRAARKGGKPDPRLLESVEKLMLASVTNDFPRECVLAEYAKNRKIVAKENDVLQCRRGFLKSAGMQGTQWDKAVAAFPPGQRETIGRRVAAEALSRAVAAKWREDNEPLAAPSEIDRLYKRYLEYNKACAASNTLIWAKATNIWKRAASGEAFRKLQEKFDEDEYKSDDGEWGVFTAENFAGDDDLQKFWPDMSPGWISPPVEGDNGLMVLKVLAVDGPRKKLARIFLHLPLFLEETDKEALAKEVRSARLLSEYNKFVSGLVEKAKIEYPNGTEIFGPKRHSPAGRGAAAP